MFKEKSGGLQTASLIMNTTHHRNQSLWEPIGGGEGLLTVISGQPILESGLNFTLGQAPQNPYIGSGLLDSTELPQHQLRLRLRHPFQSAFLVPCS